MKTFVIKHIGLWVSILFTVVFLYPTLHNGLLYWDDYAYVTNNDLIKNLSVHQVGEIFKAPGVLSHYHPITIFSLSIDYHIGGLNPFVYHTHNLLLHIANLCLVYVLFLRISKNILVATIVTLLFCLHPMHVESVAWISARKDLMYSLFFLLALIFYHIRSSSKSHGHVYYWICFLLFLMSLLSKGMAVSLPVILLGMDYLSDRKDYKKMFLEKIPFFLLTILFVCLGIAGQNDGGALNSNDEIPFIIRPFIACYGLIMYCVKALVPSSLSAFYPYPSISYLPWYIYASSIPVIGVIFYCIKQWKRKRVLVFGSVFFMASIFPVSQIIPFGTAIMADRYTYMPFLGLFFLIAYYFEKLTNKLSLKPNLRRGLLILFGGYVVLLGMTSLKRSKVWENDDTLWTDVIKHYPNNYFALGNLGDYWFYQGDNTKALAYYNKTIELEERYFMAYNNRGLIYQTIGDTAQAILDFNKAIQLKKYPKAYINKGVLLFQQGNNRGAIQAFKKGIELDGNYALAWFNLGSAYHRIGKLNLAIESLDNAERLGYEHVYLYLFRANLYSSKGMEETAFKELEKCLKIYPNNEDGLIELSKLYIKTEKINEAFLQINKVIDLYPRGKDGEAYFLRSIIYRDMQEIEKSEIDLIRAKELGYNVN